MSITEFSVLPHGARVRIKRGPFPTDAALLGRMGTVVEHSQYAPHKVGVTLDGGQTIRTFAPVELEVVEGPAAIPPEREAAKKRLVRP